MIWNLEVDSYFRLIYVEFSYYSFYRLFQKVKNKIRKYIDNNETNKNHNPNTIITNIVKN